MAMRIERGVEKLGVVEVLDIPAAHVGANVNTAATMVVAPLGGRDICIVNLLFDWYICASEDAWHALSYAVPDSMKELCRWRPDIARKILGVAPQARDRYAVMGANYAALVTPTCGDRCSDEDLERAAKSPGLVEALRDAALIVVKNVVAPEQYVDDVERVLARECRVVGDHVLCPSFVLGSLPTPVLIEYGVVIDLARGGEKWRLPA